MIKNVLKFKIIVAGLFILFGTTIVYIDYHSRMSKSENFRSLSVEDSVNFRVRQLLDFSMRKSIVVSLIVTDKGDSLSLSAQTDNYLGINKYLRVGDRVNKESGSTSIIVERGDSVVKFNYIEW